MWLEIKTDLMWWWWWVVVVVVVVGVEGENRNKLGACQFTRKCGNFMLNFPTPQCSGFATAFWYKYNKLNKTNLICIDLIFYI